MALDGQQHVGEPAKDVRANGFALIGARHALDLVGRDAEMVRPEPDQPLRQSDVGVERGLSAKLRLFQIDRPPRIGDGVSGGLCRHLVAALSDTLCHRGRRHRGRVGHLLPFRVLFSLCDGRFGLPLRVGIGNSAERLGA